MRKNLLKELILPAFWLLCFTVSKSDGKINNIQRPEKVQVKQEEVKSAEASNAVNKNKEATFTKAVFLSGF